MEGNSLKTFENLCKIFEMRIKLDREKNIDTPIDVLINYEKYAKRIDSIYNEEFEKEIKGLISPSDTLEEEEKRLKKLIKLLEDRLEKRDELEDKFYLITGKNIKGLQMIVSSSELNEKKDRLSTIVKYLDTKNEIDSINDSVSKLKCELYDLEKKESEYIAKNKILEDDLYSIFIDFLHSDEYFAKVSEDNLTDELAKIIENVKETKETLDVTKDSVSSLIDSLDGEDYSSYVDDAEKSYFVWKNREIILKIYETVIKFEDEFGNIFEKRKNVSSLIDKRNNLREELHITDKNDLEEFENIINEQINILNEEKSVIDDISNHNNRINFKEERLSELEEENSSVEVLAILKEFGLIETYDNNEVKEEENPELFDNESEINEDEIVVNEINPYRIIEIKDYPKTLNIGLAKLKGESVRDKVNKKLNPKKTFEDLLNSSDEDNSNNDVKDISFETSENSTSVWSSNSQESDVKEEAPNSSLVWEIPDNSLEKETTKEENIPVWGESNISLNNEVKEPVIETPVWDINDNSSVKEENNIDVPTWNLNSDNDTKIDNTPLWGEVKPIFEPSLDNSNNNTELDMNVGLLDNNNDNNDNMFWVPVSDSKLETGSIPNFNTSFKKSDDFNFPEL